GFSPGDRLAIAALAADVALAAGRVLRRA
ncbi:MAG: hypothetical protein JWM10_917, partial [Myxococcaceae bacterium]|nr:hypothetical protein [Myxococcaceae bacterium]